ncbi:CobW family GTP-binding protein [Serratia sp. N21D137]|uniref:CobW family GTP-binding protein n=1 Tax=Serratia sp. N21D137 TaxID=3397495 RepID=UPI0039E1049D
MMSNKIPVTVLTGFLGSGKTTLLNRILSEEHGFRIAVIENEFGEIGIDQDLVINADEEVFEMNNGCICCTVRGDLIRILGDLIKRKDKFDRVILETTGMADPGPVAQTFFVDADIQEHFELDGIITLVDAKYVSQHLDDNTDEVLAQVAFADRIILNKVDLISAAEQSSLQHRLQSINHMATIYSATMANAPIAELLDIGGFNIARAMEIKPNFLEPEYPFEWAGIWNLAAGNYRMKMTAGPDPEMSILMSTVSEDADSQFLTLAEQFFPQFSTPPQVLNHSESLSDLSKHYALMLDGRDIYEFHFSLNDAQTIVMFTQHTPEEFDLKLVSHDETENKPVSEHFFNAGHSHNSEVSSVSIEMPGLFDLDKLNTWLSVFLQVQGEDIYRMKGVLGIQGEPNRIVFQGVHMMFGSQQGTSWGDDTPFNRMVFIGKNLDEPYIRTLFESCLAEEN